MYQLRRWDWKMLCCLNEGTQVCLLRNLFFSRITDSCELCLCPINFNSNFEDMLKRYTKLKKATQAFLKTWVFINPQQDNFSTNGGNSLPRSGRPAKSTPTAQQAIMQEVKKNTRVTAKDLHKTLQTVQDVVHVRKKKCCTSQVCQKNPPECLITLL